MYPLKVTPISVLFRLTMEGTDLPQQWWCLLCFLPREPSVLVLRSRPHGPVLPAHLRLPKQPHGQRGGAAHEGARALGGRVAVCQPPARRQQQPHSSCQSRPRGQPGQAALSSQGAHGRGEERMRPEQSRDPGTAVWPSRGCQGPAQPLWLPFMHPCFSCVAVCSFPWFISTICVWKRSWSCFYSPPCPRHPRHTERPRIPACSCTCPLPILRERDGWKQQVTSRCEFWGKNAPRHQLLHLSQQRRRNIQVYPDLACCFWRHLTSTKPIPGNPGVKDTENRTKLFIIIFFFFLFFGSEAFHGVDYWEIAEISLLVTKILALASVWILVYYSCHSLG